MAKERKIRLSQAARELKVGVPTLADKLAGQGIEVDNNPNYKISMSQFEMLADEFGVDISSLNIRRGPSPATQTSPESTPKDSDSDVAVEEQPKAIDKEPEPPKAKENDQTAPEKTEKINSPKLPGLKVLDKIDLDSAKNASAKTESKKSTAEVRENKSPEPPKKAAKSPKEEEPKPKSETPKPVKEQPKAITEDPNPKKEVSSSKTETPKVKTKAEDPPKEKPSPTPKDNKPVQESSSKEPKKVAKPNPSLKKEEEKKAEPKSEPIPEPKPVENKKEITPPQNPKKEEKTPKANTPKAETKSQAKPDTQKAKDKTPPKPDNKNEGGSPSKQETAPKPDTPPQSDPKPETASSKEESEKVIKAKAKTLKGLTILDKIELPTDRKKKTTRPVASSDDKNKKKRKRKKKRITREGGATNQEAKTNTNTNQSGGTNNNNSNNNSGSNTNNNTNRRQNQNQNQSGNNNNNNRRDRNRNRSGNNNPNNRNKAGNKQPTEISEEEIQNKIKATLAKISNKGKSGRNRSTRSSRNKERENRAAQVQEETKKLRVTEFISANDLANLMDISVNELIATCISLGMFVSINQRLDAEAITYISDEFGFEVEFIDTMEEEADPAVVEEEDETKLKERAPIVTIMGHVDHGKTSLLDFIRNANVTASESGGITQHIGAYSVEVEDGRRIAFLDTPGHEAFTAMRARGAKVTDIVILVVAADDNVMPQTKEAINHSRVADVPIVIAINKVDKDSANPDKIREELSKENVLVESWGGKYQDQEISAKTGMGIEDLLEKVLLEAELLELKANPVRSATGTVIEASLDKGRGYVATVLVQNGTLSVGDVLLAGSHFGRVKAMNDHRGKRLKKAGPSTPVQVLGLDGAPQAGDTFRVMDNDREAREIANKRQQILREQNIRATKGLTLEEIGRRRALGDFKELKIIVKGDVDGSVEALSDSLLKLSTPEIEVKIIHKAVGQISEADIMLASTAEAIVIGFQVRPSGGAKKAADQEKVQIKLYSVIYNAIEEIKDAMEGMLAPTLEEIITGNILVRETFKISKVGTVAGCYVTDGYVKKQNRIRIIRDGIVIHEGEIDTLRRFKDDVMEVKSGYECGISIKSYNDINVEDVIESYENREIKRTL